MVLIEDDADDAPRCERQFVLNLRYRIYASPYSPTVGPVSYTHLDVYKRQLQYLAILLTFINWFFTDNS